MQAEPTCLLQFKISVKDETGEIERDLTEDEAQAVSLDAVNGVISISNTDQYQYASSNWKVIFAASSPASESVNKSASITFNIEW